MEPTDFLLPTRIVQRALAQTHTQTGCSALLGNLLIFIPRLISDPCLMSRTEKHRLSQPGVETRLHLGMAAGGGRGHGKRAPWRLIAAFIWMCNKLYLVNYLHSSDGHKWRFLGFGYLFHQPESNHCPVYSNTVRDGYSLSDFLEKPNMHFRLCAKSQIYSDLCAYILTPITKKIQIQISNNCTLSLSAMWVLGHIISTNRQWSMQILSIWVVS